MPSNNLTEQWFRADRHRSSSDRLDNIKLAVCNGGNDEPG